MAVALSAHEFGVSRDCATPGCGDEAIPGESSCASCAKGAARDSRLANGVRLTSTGAVLPEGLSEREWQAIADRVTRIGTALQWVIGDLVAYNGRSWAYGAKTRLAQDLGMNPKTVRNLASICRRVPPERRRPELSFSHHAAVAALDAEQQRVRLTNAAVLGMSTRELRRELPNERRGASALACEPALLERVRLDVTVDAGRADAWRRAAGVQGVTLSDFAAEALDRAIAT
jgi:hypothetical protein